MSSKLPDRAAVLKNAALPKKAAEPQEKFFTKTDLKKRGWTDLAIKRFAGEPDELRPNPYYRKGPDMQLFRAERIEAIEASPEFLEFREKAKPRQDAAARAVATKARKTLEYAESVKIKLPKLSRDRLVQLATNHYNARSLERSLERGVFYECDPATESSNPAFLDRICVNYLRHKMSAYERKLDALRGKVDRDGAYYVIRRKVLDAISNAYPYLAEACRLQIERGEAEKQMISDFASYTRRPNQHEKAQTSDAQTPR